MKNTNTQPDLTNPIQTASSLAGAAGQGAENLANMADTCKRVMRDAGLPTDVCKPLAAASRSLFQFAERTEAAIDEKVLAATAAPSSGVSGLSLDSGMGTATQFAPTVYHGSWRHSPDDLGSDGQVDE